MSTKEHRNGNIGRTIVKPIKNGQILGTIVGVTGNGKEYQVKWEDGTEHTLDAERLDAGPDERLPYAARYQQAPASSERPVSAKVSAQRSAAESYASLQALRSGAPMAGKSSGRASVAQKTETPASAQIQSPDSDFQSLVSKHLASIYAAGAPQKAETAKPQTSKPRDVSSDDFQSRVNAHVNSLLATPKRETKAEASKQQAARPVFAPHVHTPLGGRGND